MQRNSFTPAGHARPAEPHADLPAARVPKAFEGEIDPFIHGDEIEIDAPFDVASMVVETKVIMFGNFVEPPRPDRSHGRSAAFAPPIADLWQETRFLKEADLHDPVAFYCRAIKFQEADGGEARIRYEVTPPGGGTLTSELLRLRVRRGAQPPPKAPWVLDTEGDLGLVLRMENLAFRDVTVKVEGHTGKAGESIMLRWTPTEGDAFESPPQTLEGDDLPLEFTVPYATANGAPGRVSVDYVLTRQPGQPGIPSQTRVLDVIAAEDTPRFPAPIVPEAGTDKRLDPLAVTTLTVRVAANPNIPLNEKLRVTWDDKTPGGSFSGSVDWQASGVTIDVDMSVLAFNAGKSVDVTYTLVSTGAASDVATITVLPIAHESPALKTPTFSQASGDVLDMALFVGDKAEVIIDRYPRTADGQCYWLFLRGKREDGSDKVVDIAMPGRITNSGSPILLLGDVARGELEQFADGSAIVLEMELTFDQSTDRAHAIRFPRKTLTILQVEDRSYPAPLVDQSAGGVINPFITHLTIGVNGGTYRPGETVDVTWKGPTEESTHVVLVENPSPYFSRSFPTRLMIPAMGKMVDVSYTVNGTKKWESDVYRLRVMEVHESGNLAPAARLAEAIYQPDGSYILDVKSLTGPAHALLDRIEQLSGLKCWLEMKLPNRTLMLAAGFELGGDDSASFPVAEVDKNILAQQPDGAEAFLYLQIAFDGVRPVACRDARIVLRNAP